LHDGLAALVEKRSSSFGSFAAGAQRYRQVEEPTVRLTTRADR